MPDANRANRDDNASGDTVGGQPFVQEETADHASKGQWSNNEPGRFC
jgi:hypothetical protein